MTDGITLTGLVATAPRHIVTSEGLAISSFRLASTQRRFDRSTERWIDGETNWYTVTGFRQLAINVASSIAKGHRVIVVGRLKIREWENGERAGTTIEIEADSIGHDLTWGTSVFTRNISSTAETTSESAAPTSSASDEFTPELDGDTEAVAGPRDEEELSSIPF